MHALETIYGLIIPGGWLIDIHPRGLPTPLYALDEKKEVLLGHVQEADEFIEYRQADQAIQNVISRKLFGLIVEEVLSYSTYASSLEELSEHLKESWSDAILEDSIWQKAEQLGVAKASPLPAAIQRIRMVEQIGIGALIPLQIDKQD